MKATSSGVASSAAKIRSPSFSRSSSSTTTTARPAAISAMALWIGSSMSVAAVSFRVRGSPIAQQAFGVLGQYVHFQVDRITDPQIAQDGRPQRFRNQPDLEPVGSGRLRTDGRYRQRHSVDGDRALLGDVAGQLTGQPEPEGLPGIAGSASQQRRGAI